ncbi:DUF6894 family protein [Nitrobacter sp. JJSN]|uniref:DUF6894 family protein n=1 Tax=Nitrobacter sp. JJSN TaxID=3453033 RepID=UPI003F776F61
MSKFESNSTTSRAMPRYYFHIVGPADLRDRFGLIRCDDAAAIAWAQNVADALQKRNASASVVVIMHEDGREIARIPGVPVANPIQLAVDRESGDAAA